MFRSKSRALNPALVEVLGRREEYDRLGLWLEAVLAATENQQLSDEDVASLTTRLHESSGAGPFPDDPDTRSAQKLFWRTLAGRQPENLELALLSLDVDYHHAGHSSDGDNHRFDEQEILSRYIDIVGKRPALLYKTALHGELYDLAKASGAATWARFRLLEVLAQAEELGVSSELSELVTEISEELAELEPGS